MQYRRLAALGAALAVVLCLPAAASAHISVHPNTVPAGAFATLNVRVPGEEEGAYAWKVAMQLPPGFIDSTLTYTPAGTPSVMRRRRTSGVQPIDCRMESCMAILSLTSAGVLPLFCPLHRPGGR